MYEYKVSICILTMDQWDLTKKCLDSLEKTSWDEKIELVIVDNGSKDETVENLLQYQKNNNKIFDYTVLINSSNRGCTGGRNQACRIAKGEYIVIIDNDVEIIESTWLKKLFEFYVLCYVIFYNCTVYQCYFGGRCFPIWRRHNIWIDYGCVYHVGIFYFDRGSGGICIPCKCTVSIRYFNE